MGAIATYVVADTLVKNPPAIPSISLPRIEIKQKVETKPKTKDIAPTLPKPPPKNPVHHIVAQGVTNERAAPAQAVLKEAGIDRYTDPAFLSSADTFSILL